MAALSALVDLISKKVNGVDDVPPKSAGLLIALNRLAEDGRRHVYQGTVPARTKARRRAANRVAKASRRANRN